MSRQLLLADPLKHVPAWTVAAFDPTIGKLPRRQLNKPVMSQYLKALAKAGAPGVLIAASTGWGHARNFEEHRETLLAAGDISLEGSIKQALLRIEDPLEKNLALLDELALRDYGIIWTRRGSHLPPRASAAKVAAAMLPLVTAAIERKLPVGIYSISTVDGAPLTVEAAKTLFELLGKEMSRSVVAVKVTEPDFDKSTQTFLNDSAFTDKKIVQGWDAHYARAMLTGLRPDGTNHCGATSGAAACMVWAYKAMHKAVLESNWESLRNLQAVLTEVFYSMQGPDKKRFPDLQIAKWVMGLGHPLTETRTSKQAEPLLAKLEELMATPLKQAATVLILKSLLLMEDEVISPVSWRLRQLLGS